MLCRVSKVLDDTAHFIVVANKEKLQRTRVFAKEQTHFQSCSAFKNIFPQSPDGNAAVSVRTTKAIRDDQQRGFHPVNIRTAQMLERGVETRA